MQKKESTKDEKESREKPPNCKTRHEKNKIKGKDQKNMKHNIKRCSTCQRLMNELATVVDKLLDHSRDSAIKERMR